MNFYLYYVAMPKDTRIGHYAAINLPSSPNGPKYNEDIKYARGVSLVLKSSTTI